jgi:hypothetical protein
MKRMLQRTLIGYMLAVGLMLSVAFTKYECFSENLAEKVHNLDADQLNIALSNTAPNVATNTVRADITELATGNGYTQDTHDTTNSTSRTGGVTSVIGVDVVITASGAVGPFRYAILYNTTATGDPLIGHWDYGSSISLAAGETFTVDFGSSMFTIT